MLKRGIELRPFELGQAEDATRELADASKSGSASRRYGRRGQAMKKKQSTDMQATVQRRFVQPESEISPSTAIPRSTEFDLIPDPRGGECSFFSNGPGNAVWTERNRP